MEKISRNVLQLAETAAGHGVDVTKGNWRQLAKAILKGRSPELMRPSPRLRELARELGEGFRQMEAAEVARPGHASHLINPLKMGLSPGKNRIPLPTPRGGGKMRTVHSHPANEVMPHPSRTHPPDEIRRITGPLPRWYEGPRVAPSPEASRLVEMYESVPAAILPSPGDVRMFGRGAQRGLWHSILGSGTGDLAHYRVLRPPPSRKPGTFPGPLDDALGFINPQTAKLEGDIQFLLDRKVSGPLRRAVQEPGPRGLPG
jgi:hypothetical protein